MRNVRRLILAAVLAVFAVGLLVTISPSGNAGAAKASGLWVSNTTPITTGKSTSCSTPNFSTIQAAINDATVGATVHVCAGTYPEQLQITKAITVTGTGSPTVSIPAVVANGTTACDAAMLPSHPTEPNQVLVDICGGGTVSISGLTLNAAWPGSTCYDSLYGVLVAGGANLKLTSTNITAAGASPINGCQGGVAVQVGSTRSTPSEVGTATLTGDSISGYQKNGMTIDGVGSSAVVNNVTVTGAGETTQIAQNGIQVSRGATAKITSSTISGNECDYAGVCGSDGFNDTQAAGLLFYNAGNGSSVTASTISGNDLGVYTSFLNSSAASQLALTSDQLTNDRYEAVQLDQGVTTLNKDNLSGGNIGLQAIQYNGQAFAAQGVAKSLKVTGMSVAAVDIDSDGNSADFPVVLQVSNSQISNNPAGHSALGSVMDNSPNSSVTLKKDS